MPDDQTIVEQLAAHVDGGPPVTLDEVRRRPVSADGRRAGVVLAALASAAVVVAAVLVLRAERGDDARLATVTTTSVVSDTAWLTPFGDEVPAPPTPAGWRVLDVADVRLAIPPNWVVPASRSCPAYEPGAAGALLAPVASGPLLDEGCAPPTSIPSHVVVVEQAVREPGAVPTSPTTVGTFAATHVELSCFGGPDLVIGGGYCTPYDVLSNGYAIRERGSEGGVTGVLPTLTDSGPRRVLQRGPIADTRGWRREELDGVAVLVPPRWNRTVRVRTSPPATDDVPQGPDSMIAQPGSCDRATFDPAPVVMIGDGVPAACPPEASPQLSLDATDGVWLHTFELPSGGRTTVAAGKVAGLSVSVSIEGPHLRAVISGPQGPVALTLGVGADPSIARAILRSIEPA